MKKCSWCVKKILLGKTEILDLTNSFQATNFFFKNYHENTFLHAAEDKKNKYIKVVRWNREINLSFIVKKVVKYNSTLSAKNWKNVVIIGNMIQLHCKHFYLNDFTHLGVTHNHSTPPLKNYYQFKADWMFIFSSALIVLFHLSFATFLISHWGTIYFHIFIPKPYLKCML